MISKKLKELARVNGLKEENGVAYGLLSGCFVTLCSGAGYQRMYICAGLAQGENPAANAEAVGARIIELAADFDTYHIMNDRKNLPGERRLSGIAIKGKMLVQVNFYDDKKTFDCMQTFINSILPQLAPLADFKRCMYCGQTGGEMPVLLYGEAVVLMHENCAHECAEQEQKKTAGRKRPGNNFTGMLGAFIGAMLGAVVWAIVGMIGYIAGIVGWLIAWLSSKGFDLLGGKSVKIKIASVIVFVVLAVLLGNMLTLGYLFHDIYVSETKGMSPFQLAQVVSEGEYMRSSLENYFSDPEGMGEFWRNAGMGLLFAALGCWSLLSKMKQESTPAVAVLKG